MAQKQLDRDPAKTAERLSTIQAVIDQGVKSLRRLIRDMRPAYLEDLGLAPALEMLCEQHTRSYGQSWVY